jgi:hypothetical protein
MVYPIISMITYYFIYILMTFSIFQVTCPNVERQSEFHEQPCSELKGKVASNPYINNKIIWFNIMCGSLKKQQN